MKRYISLLLSFILVFSLFTPVIQAVGFELDNSEINEGDNYLEEPFDDCILTSQNVIGVIPENVESLFGDIGTDNCIIADIKPFSTFSLRSTTSSSVEIDVSELGKDSVDILHFIEDAAMITEDMAVLNVSNYEEESKDIDREKLTVEINDLSKLEEKIIELDNLNNIVVKLNKDVVNSLNLKPNQTFLVAIYKKQAAA